MLSAQNPKVEPSTTTMMRRQSRETAISEAAGLRTLVDGDQVSQRVIGISSRLSGTACSAQMPLAVGLVNPGQLAQALVMLRRTFPA